jgi:hypothetical protein
LCPEHAKGHGHVPLYQLSCDPDKRFAAYKKQLALYKRLKPYFVRGAFHGLSEHIHFHGVEVVEIYSLTNVSSLTDN